MGDKYICSTTNKKGIMETSITETALIDHSTKNNLPGSIIEESSLPLPVQLKTGKGKNRRSTTTSAKFTKPKILVVDDNGFNLYTMSNMLKLLNVECEQALNGMEALTLLQLDKKLNGTNTFSLVFMDCFMPVMDGFIVYIYIYIINRQQKLS